MSPQEFVQSLCSRYGVPRAFGERMLPLVERSKKVRPEMRERLLAFVERSFAAEATRRAGEPKGTRWVSRGKGEYTLEEIREMILSGASAFEIRHKALQLGMISLRRSGLMKIKGGVTSVEEVLRETVNQ